MKTYYNPILQKIKPEITKHNCSEAKKDPIEMEFIPIEKAEHMEHNLSEAKKDPIEMEFIPIEKAEHMEHNLSEAKKDPIEIEFIPVENVEHMEHNLSEAKIAPIEIEFIPVENVEHTEHNLSEAKIAPIEMEFIPVENVGYTEHNLSQAQVAAVDYDPELMNALHSDPYNVPSIFQKENRTENSQINNLFNETSSNNNFSMNNGKQCPVPDVPVNLLKSSPKKIRITTTSPEKKTHRDNDIKKISCHDMEIELKNEITFKKINNILYYWDPYFKHYCSITNINYDEIIRQYIPKKFVNSITSYSCREIFNWLNSDRSLNISEEDLKHSKKFIPFKNCIIEPDSYTAFKHSEDYFFTSVINANFPLNSDVDGYYFEKFLSQITNGNEHFYLRIQELFGYVISEHRELKIIPFFIGPKDCGKSVVLKILEFLVGEENVSHLSLYDFNSNMLLAELHEKKLNTCGETSEIPLQKLDIIKKLTGGDFVIGNPKNQKPFKFVNKAVLVFAGNHLPILKKTDHSNAFRKRLLIFPFNNSVPENRKDPLLFEKIKKEMSYIAKWAVDGLIRLKENNFIFTHFEEIEEILEDYFVCENKSIAEFVNTQCVLDPSVKEYSENLMEAYLTYCKNAKVIPLSTHALHKYLKQNLGLESTKFRKGKLNKRGYLGIGLISKEDHINAEYI